MLCFARKSCIIVVMQNSTHKNLQSVLDLQGKTYIIMGVANKWSIAWGIAQALDNAGARIAFTYAGAPFEARVKNLLADLRGEHRMYECDVRSDESIHTCFAAIHKDFDKVDGLVHSVAFADKQYLNGEYMNVSRSAFSEAMDISCYSFTAAAREVRPFLNPRSSLITLSYYGAEKWVVNYNVMGVAKAALEASVMYLASDLGRDERRIRVNAISSGPIKTLSAAGISKFEHIGKWTMHNSPVSEYVTPDDVGKTALYLLSDLSSGVTAEVIHVDCGYHSVGAAYPDSPCVTLD